MYEITAEPERGTLLAKSISYLFHPLLLPTLGLLVLFHLDEPGLWLPSDELQLFLHAVTLLATFFLPILCTLALLKFGLIDSLEMRTKEERKLPYLTSAIFYFSESYFLMRIDVPVIIQSMMLGATFLIVSTLIINIFWKISAHMVGIGGICGIFLAISYRLQINLHLTLIALLLIAGLVAFSRLRLNAHSSAQVYAGFFLGVIVQLVFLLTL